jgi:ribosomal protein S27E
MDENEKAEARIYISIGGISLFLSVLCFGCRQLAILEDRIATEVRYEILEQELVELTDEGLDEFFYEDNKGT